MNRNPPTKPKYIQTSPNDPSGIQKAAIMPPIRIKYLKPQNPFCMPALGSLDALTLIMMMDIREKKRVTIKQSLYTAW